MTDLDSRSGMELSDPESLIVRAWRTRPTNSNALLLGDKLIAIDHGDALAGFDRAGETGAALASRTVLPASMKSHFLLGWLRMHASGIDWVAIEASLACVGPPGVASLLASIPEELGSAEQNYRQEIYSRLRPFLLQRLQVLPELVQNLRSLIETKP